MSGVIKWIKIFENMQSRYFRYEELEQDFDNHYSFETNVPMFTDSFEWDQIYLQFRRFNATKVSKKDSRRTKKIATP